MLCSQQRAVKFLFKKQRNRAYQSHCLPKRDKMNKQNDENRDERIGNGKYSRQDYIFTKPIRTENGWHTEFNILSYTHTEHTLMAHQHIEFGINK